MKKTLSLVLCLAIIIGLLAPIVGVRVNAASNPYPTWQTVGGVGTIPCTYYAWQQTYERMGIALPSWGNAINWYYNAPGSGYSVGATPKANSIAVWTISGHGYGHVAFVTAVNGSQMTVNEGGRTDKTSTSGIVNGQVLPSTVGTTWYGRTLVGFVYLDGGPENLGNDFYAQISHPSSGHGLCQVGNNVELGTANTQASYWRFIRQADGSYKIYSYTGGLLDVSYAETADGTNIAVCAGDSGSRAQNWYLVETTGGYYFYSGLCSKVIDITSGSVQKGANAQLYTFNGSAAQVFKITKECKHPSYSSSVTKQPTCTTTGIRKYTCNSCSYSYTASIAKKAHSYNTIQYHYANCTSQGYTEYCCDCGHSYTDSYKNALGHTYSSSCDTSCNRCSATRTAQHSYSNNCDTTCNKCSAKRSIKHTYTNSCDTACNVCKAKRTIKHKYTNNCDKACNVCKAKRTTSHTYKTVTTKATLTRHGKVEKKCSKCGYVTSSSTIRYPKTIKLSAASYTYNGKVKTPTVTIKDSAGKTLKKNTDYTVSYSSGRKNVGTYKVTIKFKGKYSGTKALTFKILPKAASVNKLTAKTKGFTVKLNRQLTQSTGYEIQYATTKSFKSPKTATVTSYKTSTKSISSLKGRTTYYVRVRTYKTVSGVKYYSNWSTAKYIKTK